MAIARSDDAFQGKFFASFYAFDTESGIDHYELRENGDGWVRAWSPYILETQSGDVLLEVKAIDVAGNERIASTSAHLQIASAAHWGPWWFWLVILLAIGVTVWRILKRVKSDGETDDGNKTNDSSVKYDRGQALPSE